MRRQTEKPRRILFCAASSQLPARSSVEGGDGDERLPPDGADEGGREILLYPAGWLCATSASMTHRPLASPVDREVCIVRLETSYSSLLRCCCSYLLRVDDLRGCETGWATYKIKEVDCLTNVGQAMWMCPRFQYVLIWSHCTYLVSRV